MNKVIRKLSSRKLWVAIAGISTGIAMILGVTESEISTVAGSILALVSAVTYIITEGKIDAETAKNAVVNVQNITNTIEGAEKNE